MVYIIAMWCDGACRNNGGYNKNLPVVAGAGVYYPRGKRSLREQSKALFPRSGSVTATNNRAELHGLIMALETALKVVDHVRSDPYRNPFILIHINMDSDYIVKSMTEWRFKWQNNGWRNAKGLEVANKDLFLEVIRLHDRLQGLRSKVKYHHVYREANTRADELANEGCEKAIAHKRKQAYRYSSSYTSDSD